MTEQCNLVDDNCDGAVDNGLPPLTCGVGECATTSPSCIAGVPQPAGSCIPLPPQAEQCDGLDNDCDGFADDGNPGGGVPCAVTGQLGVCAQGITACSGGTIVCQQVNFPSGEVCDGQDNNCNGLIDDGVLPQVGNACVVAGQLGPCQIGALQCTGGALQCAQTVFPSAEVCDGLDNDCNGAADDGNPGSGNACLVGLLGQCDQGVTQCVAGAVQCQQTVFPSAEVCDGFDNDCDGGTDEGDPGGGVACSAGLPGLCDAGTTQCVAGAIQCNQTVFPVAEACDGLDNDCDTFVDDGNPGGGAACVVGGQLGVCAQGMTQCSGGGLACSQVNFPVAETCNNGLDDDCDGLADCIDPSCSADPACVATEVNCVDGVDNDGDGPIDCADPDCALNPACLTAEDCTNGVDDDGDALADCADTDCNWYFVCGGTETFCNDGVDSDQDGLLDCADPDCAGDPACAVGPENCTDGVDNDGDLLADCLDADCQFNAACVGYVTSCGPIPTGNPCFVGAGHPCTPGGQCSEYDICVCAP